MNYYIQGNKEKADQIKAAFERLGYDVKNWLFTTGVYYTLNGRIVNTKIGSNEYELILNSSDYKELKLPKTHYDISNFKPFDHCRFKPTETHDWIYADFWYVQAHYKVEHLSAIEKWES